MNPIWLENIIKEMASDIKDLKQIIAQGSKAPAPKKGK